MPDREPLQVALSPAMKLGAVLGAVVLVGMLATLVAVLVSLEGTRSEIRTTREGVVEAEERFERVTRQLDPLLSAAAPLQDGSAQRGLRRTGRDVATAARELPALARSAKEASDAAEFVATDLEGADLGGTLRAVRALAGVGLGGDRLARVLDSTDAVLSNLDRAVLRNLGRAGLRSAGACADRLRRLPPAADRQLGCLVRLVPDFRSTLRRQLSTTQRQFATQLTQLDVNEGTLDLLAKSLVIQREILERTRSLDRKTGPAPPASPVEPGATVVP